MKRTTPFDPDYIVQGCYSDDRVCDSDGSDNEAEAVTLALDMQKSLYFEGDYVVVITRDGELVYDSRDPKQCEYTGCHCRD